MGTHEARSFRSALTDAPVTIIVAVGRASLSGFALLAVFLDPSQPDQFPQLVYIVLALYFLTSAAVAVWVWFKPHLNPRSALLNHAVDLLAAISIIFLTDGSTSPFFVFFTYCLLSATIQWAWRGVLFTGLVFIVTYSLLALVQLLAVSWTSYVNEEVARTIVRAGYLFVITGMLTYVAVVRSFAHDRLVQLASRPTLALPFDEAVEQMLLTASSITNAASVTFISMQGDRCEAISLQGRSFQRFPDASNLLLKLQHERPVPHGSFLAEVERGVSVVAAVEGARCAGYVVLGGRSAWDTEHLLLAEIIASQLVMELDRNLLQRELGKAAAIKERVRVGRDLHDSVIQTLTAACVQLKMCEVLCSGDLTKKLKEIRKRLGEEQKRIRTYAEGTNFRAYSEQFHVADEITKTALDASHQWGCNIEVTVEPKDSIISSHIGEELKMMVSEAMANAARHGKASLARVNVDVAPSKLRIIVKDDGTGLPGLSGRYGHQSLARNKLGPKSMLGRISSLGGTLTITTGKEGTCLIIDIPR